MNIPYLVSLLVSRKRLRAHVSLLYPSSDFLWLWHGKSQVSNYKYLNTRSVKLKGRHVCPNRLVCILSLSLEDIR